MARELEDLEIMKDAELLADEVWHEVMRWNAFNRDAVGTQLVRSVDSIGANIAESYGRYRYGEKIQFLYYARGSLAEAKYWIRRSHSRLLLSAERSTNYATRLASIGRQLNAFTAHLKARRRAS